MPIKKCTTKSGTPGYKWGESGKCYTSRQKALKQMKAIMASGYKEKKKGGGK